MYLLNMHIKTIDFLFCNYVFNSSQKWLSILVHISYFLCWSNMISISLHVIFHITPVISPRAYIIPWAYRISGWYHDLGLIKGMLWKMSYNNLYLSPSDVRQMLLSTCADVFVGIMVIYRTVIRPITASDFLICVVCPQML